ncbi:VOC family protein [Cellulomonas sp. PhB150]|uniref:VOC family protein n=1 Tax=Cellulomonas sp. PhB150 TaxID=2485188 RepID=UPI000F493357|nr:VOC family protein [Cellulomonas sp. PhB150]ROS23972.1 hypothetical protein EDF34_3035 [Cellulomonas sp. PhB150]
MLREVIVDVPSSSFQEVAAFWAGALAATSHPVPDEPEFVSLHDPASLPHVAVQDIGADGTPRFHLDVETDDVEAEVARLTALGATVHARRPTFVVMSDPVGLLLCVLPPSSDEFATHSREV